MRRVFDLLLGSWLAHEFLCWFNWLGRFSLG